MSGRQKAVLAVTLVLLMWLPTGISHEEGPALVTGHSSFWNGEAYDPCLASIAGIMRSRVMWFNDQVLVERYGGRGTYIYVTEYGAPDPRAIKALFTEGVFYDFTDPNGVQWHVEEAWYSLNLSPSADGGGSIPNPMALGEWEGTSGSVSTHYSAETVSPKDKYYVWFVELSAQPVVDQYYPTLYYNFLNMVDTCKFNRERLDELQDENDDPYPYYSTENHSTSLGPTTGHPNGAVPHDHEKWMVDLWVGRKPETVPFGEVSTNPSSWESGWTAYAVEDAQNESGVPEGFEESLP